MTRLDRQQHVLDLLIPQLEDGGYSVFVQPPRSLLPKFMDGYAPDAVAIGKPRNIAIEIVAGDKPGHAVETLKERFAAQDEWALRVYYYRPEHEVEIVAPATRGAIEAAATRVEGLVSAGLPDAALLLGWSALEAAGRLLLPDRLRRPQAAGRLIELLAQEGVVPPDEAQRLRRLLVLRNRIAHGDLATLVLPEDVTDLVAILRIALAESVVESTGA